MRLRAHHKLFLSYCLVVAAVVLALSVGVERTLRHPLLEQAGVDLQRELALGLALYEETPGADPDLLARRMGSLTGHRVTIVDPSGRVLGDSGVEPERVAELDDHSGRPEVRSAMEEGRGMAIRFSDSVGADQVYAAVRAPDGVVVRFSMMTEEIDHVVARVRSQILQVGGVALLLAALLSLGFSIAVTRPLRRMKAIASAMAEGDLSDRIRIERSDELGDLGDALDRLANELERRLGQLEGEREEMQALIDAMAEGVLAIDEKGLLRRANPAAREIFDLEGDYEGVPPEAVARRRAFMDLVARARRGEAIPPTEIEYDDKHLLATAQPLPRGGAVLVFLDTTELRRLEGVRRDFVANASHELKTPLTVIRGHAETLQDEDLPPGLRARFLASLHSNAERLQSILEDLLDLSRIESGGWTVSPEVLEVEEVARDAWSAFVDQAEEKGVEFLVECEGEARRVRADPGALTQIFSNLFSNALRYTGPGGSIQVRSRLEKAGQVAVEVADTGTGIPEKHLGRIFERFYRADPARSRADGGTGLGLAIVKHLVERHGGAVQANSRLDEGTTVRFTLPRAVGSSSGSDAPPPSTSSRSDSTPGPTPPS